MSGTLTTPERAVAPLAGAPREPGGNGRGSPAAVRRQERPFALSDCGNAEFYLATNGPHLRYCAGLGGWHRWDGARWERDETGEALYRAQYAMKGLARQAVETAEGRIDEELLKHAIASQREPRLRGLLALAACERGIAVRAREFDADPWLLNCENGTLQLREGTLGKHDPGDLITKTTGVEYDADARSDLWDRVLETALPDPDVRAFFQCAAGYSLTGDVSEERLFLPLGPTATGKSTLLGALKYAMGDYATTASFETFLHRPVNGGPRNDLAALKGARLVLSLETDAGVRLAEGVVKNITGGDTVSARKLYGEPFEFRPSAKLWLVANDAPRIRDDDAAMWRRVLRIPFDVTIPEGRRDPHLKEQLREPEHAAAILAWAVAGCQRWLKDGLRVPAAVKDATATYHSDMDPLAPFLAEYCGLELGGRVAVGRLRDAYMEWAQRSGERRPLGAKEFNKRLRALGIEQSKDGGVRSWEGLVLV